MVYNFVSRHCCLDLLVLRADKIMSVGSCMNNEVYLPSKGCASFTSDWILHD
ncbi:hypothetical protein MtrunA17_Chr8g0340601 [Medicago truncatula]|uniref:Uncharacterized protein n=1 Tax=Medicago truncatula TaxID=3880 RepID=A0A396GEE5_MEDTR|nr:hypothetical protein MtrunA17_Chr8g0340601 [Medicago truncatula]